jgi:membrane-associated phospholipid phosphatase
MEKKVSSLPPSAPYKHTLRVTDLVTFSMCLIYAIVEFSFIGRSTLVILGINFDRCVMMGSFFLVAAVGVGLFVRLFNGRSGFIPAWLRVFYCMFYFGMFFSESIRLSHFMYNGATFDAVFASIDARVFGFQPATEFWKALPENRLITELFFFGYFTYFVLMAGPFWLLLLRGQREKAERGIAYICTAFYLMYLFYLFFPVMGPKYYFPELRAMWYTNFDGYIFTNIMKGVFARMNLSGAAFPSSHAAITVLSLAITFRFWRKLSFVLAPFTVLLLVSTVYIYAHYAVDTVAGALLGVVFFFVIPPLVRMLEKPAIRISLLFDRIFPGTRRS